MANMAAAYARAVSAERRSPRAFAELAEYVRWEYGPGTGLGYFLAEMASAAPSSRRRRRTGTGMFRAFVRALRAAFPANGRSHRTTEADSTAVGE